MVFTYFEVQFRTKHARKILSSRETNNRYRDYKFAKTIETYFCGNHKVKAVTMNKISHLLTFSFYYPSLPFHSKIFCQYKTPFLRAVLCTQFLQQI